MKKWLILAYIITVLVISSLAKASSNVLLDKVSYDPGTLSLSVSGLVNGTCGTYLKSSIIETQATEEGPVVILEISHNNPNDCRFTMASINKFDLLIDIKNLGLASGSIYTIAFNNRFTSSIDPMFKVSIPQSVSTQKMDTKQYLGVLQKDNNNKYFIQNKSQLVYLKASINLDKYLNNKVLIDGLEIVQFSGPGFDLTVQDPLRTSDQIFSSTVYVLGISTVN